MSFFVHSKILFLSVALSFLGLKGCSQPHTMRGGTQISSSLKYLVRDSLLQDYYDFKNGNIRIFAFPYEKEDNHPECVIYKEEIEEIRLLVERLPADSLLLFYTEKKSQYLKDMPAYHKYILSAAPKIKKDSLHPLKGLRIALDPGHIEASMVQAEIEGKFIKMRASDETGLIPIAFNEANLTLATARILADSLKNLGAEVMITRPKPGIGLLGMTFEEWYNHYMSSSLNEEIKAGRMDTLTAEWFKTEASIKEVYQKLYVPIDLNLRAEKINAFHPDMTIIIHYNVHGPNWEQHDSENYCKPTDENYNMAFVAGSFKDGEMSRIEDRVAFLRLLLTDDVENSIRLSDYVVQAFSEKLQVPAVVDKPELVYLRNSCILTDKAGVYARNLNLTRKVKGVLCYGESLCQDNRTECAWLNQKLINVGDVAAPSRVKMVADAYLEAVKRYVKE